MTNRPQRSRISRSIEWPPDASAPRRRLRCNNASFTSFSCLHRNIPSPRTLPPDPGTVHPAHRRLRSSLFHPSLPCQPSQPWRLNQQLQPYHQTGGSKPMPAVANTCRPRLCQSLRPRPLIRWCPTPRCRRSLRSHQPVAQHRKTLRQPVPEPTIRTELPRSLFR